MATTPDHITITVDEDALRRQIRGIVQDELREAGHRLRQAANSLDPDWWRENEAQLELYLRGKWEAKRNWNSTCGGSGRRSATRTPAKTRGIKRLQRS